MRRTLVFSIAFSAAGCAAPLVVFGPAVQSPGPDGVKVVATTSRQVKLRLLAGGRSFDDPAPSRDHLFVVPVPPRGRVPYSLSDLSTGEVLGSGYAPGAFAEATGPRIAVVGDSRVQGIFGGAAQRKVAAALRELLPDLVLHLGDLAEARGGAAESTFLRSFAAPFRDLYAWVPVYPTMGNHDRDEDGRLPYLDYFALPEGPEGERYYSFDSGLAHFVCCDTSREGALSKAQLAWLEADLAASRRPWKVVFTHEPPLDATAEGALKDPPELAPLLDVCRRGGVRLLLCGHHHAYQRYRPIPGAAGDLTLIVSGGGGANLSASAASDSRVAASALAYHFLSLELDEDAIRGEAVGLDGKPFDRWKLGRAPAAAAPR